MAVLCAGFAAGQEQEQQTGFTADVNLVLLHVAVIDPRGSDVTPLSVEDFTVFDDGVKQTVELFVAPADAPLAVRASWAQPRCWECVGAAPPGSGPSAGPCRR